MSLNAAQNALIKTIEIHRSSGAIPELEAADLIAQVEHGDLQTAAANLNSLLGVEGPRVFASRGHQALHEGRVASVYRFDPFARQATEVLNHVNAQDDTFLAAGGVPEDRSSDLIRPFLVGG